MEECFSVLLWTDQGFNSRPIASSPCDLGKIIYSLFISAFSSLSIIISISLFFHSPPPLFARIFIESLFSFQALCWLLKDRMLSKSDAVLAWRSQPNGIVGKKN